jgi:O-antigen ligase
MVGKKKRHSKKNRRSIKKSKAEAVSRTGYLLAALLFFQPLILQRLTADQFDMGKLVFLYCITAAFLIWRSIKLNQKNQILELDGVNIALFAFLVSSLIATIASIHVPTSFFGKYQRYEGLLTIFCLVVLFRLARERNPGERYWAEIGITASVALVSIYGIVQRFNLDPLSWGKQLALYGGRVFSTIGNPVMLGGFLVLTLPVCLGLVMKRDNRLKAAGLSVWIIGLICLFFTESEGAWFGFWIGALATAFFLGVQKGKGFGWMRWISAGLVLITGVVLTALISIKSPLFYSSSGIARMEFYKGAARMFRARPLFGWGPDTLSFVFPRFAGLSYIQNWGVRDIVPTKVHNLFLELLSTYGVFAFMAFVAMTALLITYGIKRLRSDETDPMAPFLLGSLIGYLAYSLTGLTEIGVSPAWWIIMGFLAGKPAARSRLSLSIPRVFPVTAGLIMASVLAVAALSHGIADRNYLLAEGTAELRLADAYYYQAEKLNPYNQMVFVDHGFRWIEKGIEENNLDKWQTGIDILKRTVDLNPDEAGGHINLGIAYNRGAKRFNKAYYRQSVSALEHALIISPLSREAHYQLSVALLSAEQYDDALKESRAALRISPEYVPAHLIQAGALFNQGRIEEARKVLKKAQVLDPGNKQIRDSMEFLNENR